MMFCNNRLIWFFLHVKFANEFTNVICPKTVTHLAKPPVATVTSNLINCCIQCFFFCNKCKTQTCMVHWKAENGWFHCFQLLASTFELEGAIDKLQNLHINWPLTSGKLIITTQLMNPSVEMITHDQICCCIKSSLFAIYTIVMDWSFFLLSLL